MKTVHRMFEPCRNDEHDDCAGDVYEGLNDGMQGATGRAVQCSCDCHVPWSEDRHYAAQYAYACGYHD
jgi:hypothetical protein